MDILIFIYNIFLIVLYTVVVTSSILNYSHKKRPLFAVKAALFLSYIFDNVIIYMTEFLEDFSTLYDLQFMTVPAFKTLIYLVSNYCLVTIQRLVLPGRQTVRDSAALILLGLALLFAPMAGGGALKVWLYYLPAQIFTFYLGTSGLLYLSQYPESLDREMVSYKTLLGVTVIFSVLILIEDTIVIFSFDVYSNPMVKINNRSLSEDIMSIIYSIYAIKYLTRQLRLPRLDVGDAGTIFQETPPPSVQIPPDQEDADTAFLHFANHYQLTSREQDILKILLTDKNNQEISDALYISIGTVKTHIHNIFQKVNVTKRSQLLRIYYEYKRKMPWK